MSSLSVLIPARNEIFLNQTIREVLNNARGDTECIVVLDGAPPHETLPVDSRLKVIYLARPIGQRAALNLAARESTADYIMKLDAHCRLAKEYDTTLMASAQELGRDVTQVPLMYNLHAFDWVCADGHRRYQGPSGPCEACGKPTERGIVWRRRMRRKTWLWRFDADLHFQYWQDEQKKHEEDYVETMSLLGACFFMSRERYWELGGSDEAHGSWGQQGTEIACKTWLSGGRLICNRKTWFAHMFRTRSGTDFSFPYPNPQDAIDRARSYSQDLWKNGKWPGAVRDLDWLIEKFNPPGFEKETKESAV